MAAVAGTEQNVTGVMTFQATGSCCAIGAIAASREKHLQQVFGADPGMESVLASISDSSRSARRTRPRQRRARAGTGISDGVPAWLGLAIAEMTAIRMARLLQLLMSRTLASSRAKSVSSQRNLKQNAAQPRTMRDANLKKHTKATPAWTVLARHGGAR